MDNKRCGDSIIVSRSSTIRTKRHHRKTATQQKMYSRRQRSTRNAAATTNAGPSANGRTTRGRTSKAKHPRRGGGNPDTARVRASIEKPPVIPWVKVMRPPALHLRRTFLVEKWVRPSDLTEKEREIYEAGQKKKEDERQRLLKWQQQKREQEKKEKAEQEKREREEKDRLQAAAAQAAAQATAQGGENAKPLELKEGQGNQLSASAKLVPDATTTTAPMPMASIDAPIVTKTEAVKSEAGSAVSSMELEQTQVSPSQAIAVDASSAPTPTSTVNNTEESSEKTQATFTESKPTTQLAPDTSLPESAYDNRQEKKGDVPQTKESESKQIILDNSSTQEVNPTVANQPTVEAQQQQQQNSSDPEALSQSIEPSAKKPRIE